MSGLLSANLLTCRYGTQTQTGWSTELLSRPAGVSLIIIMNSQCLIHDTNSLNISLNSRYDYYEI